MSSRNVYNHWLIFTESPQSAEILNLRCSTRYIVGKGPELICASCPLAQKNRTVGNWNPLVICPCTPANPTVYTSESLNGQWLSNPNRRDDLDILHHTVLLWRDVQTLQLEALPDSFSSLQDLIKKMYSHSKWFAKKVTCNLETNVRACVGVWYLLFEWTTSSFGSLILPVKNLCGESKQVQSRS